MLRKTERTFFAFAAAALLLIAVIALTAAATAVSAKADAAESKIALNVESYSGEWKAGKPELSPPSNAIDGNPDTAWYCQWGRTNNAYADQPNITLGFGGEKTVARIEVTMASTYVPQDILIELGDGAGRWAKAGRYTGMTAGQTVKCTVANQNAEKLRVTVMKKSVPDKSGNSLALIAEITAYATDGTAKNELNFYSDVTAGGKAICSDRAYHSEYLNDGVYTETGLDNGTVITKFFGDCESEGAESGDGEIVGYGYSSAKSVSKLSLWSSSAAGEIYGFPVDFAIVYSQNGKDWFVVPDQAYFDYEPCGGENAFEFARPVSAKRIGIKVLKKSLSSSGKSYIVSFGEMRLYSGTLDTDAHVTRPEDTADMSAVSIEGIIPGGVYSVGDSAEIDLSRYFSSKAGTLTYSCEGIGEIDGSTYKADLNGLDAGRYTVTVSAGINALVKKEQKFVITVQSADKIFVQAVAMRVEKSVFAEEEAVVDLSELFTYTGADTLAYTATRGKLSGNKLTLLYESSGSFEEEIVCYPVSDESLGAKLILAVDVSRAKTDMSPLSVGKSEYTDPTLAFVLTGVIAAVLSAAGVAALAVFASRKKAVKSDGEEK